MLCQIDSQFLYPWYTQQYSLKKSLKHRISPPEVYERIKVDNNSFAAWLRHLPLKEAGTQVMLYNGRAKNRQDVHEAVVDIDIGGRDLQQCADAVIRLRSEYLYARKRFDDISFHFTNGQLIAYIEWRKGKKIAFKNNRAQWIQTNNNQTDYSSFRKYNNLIFAYAGTYSLSKNMHPVVNLNN
ncbi:MAG: DUF4846 domain-containing protein, partial [Bacteroidota bacterium]